MKKFSALLVAITLVTMVFASAAFAAGETYVYSDLYGKVGVLKVDESKLVTLSTDNIGIATAGLGTDVRLFTNSQDYDTAVAAGNGGYVKVKASGDVVYTNPRNAEKTAAKVGQVTSFTQSGDSSIAVVGRAGLYAYDATAKSGFTAQGTGFLAAVPQAAPVAAATDASDAATALSDALDALSASGVELSQSAQNALGNVLSTFTGVTASTKLGANSKALKTLLNSVAMTDKGGYAPAMTINSNGSISFYDGATTSPMADDVVTYSPIKKFKSLGSIGEKFYVAGETGVRTLGAVTTLAAYYAGLKDAADAVSLAGDLRDFVNALIKMSARNGTPTTTTSNLAKLAIAALTIKGAIADASALGTLTAATVAAEADEASEATGTTVTGTALAGGTVELDDANNGEGLSNLVVANDLQALVTAATAMDTAVSAYLTATGTDAKKVALAGIVARQQALTDALEGLMAEDTDPNTTGNQEGPLFALAGFPALVTLRNTAEDGTGVLTAAVAEAIATAVKAKTTEGKEALMKDAVTAADATVEDLETTVKVALGAQLALEASLEALDAMATAATGAAVELAQYKAECALALLNNLGNTADETLTTALIKAQDTAIGYDDISAVATSAASAAATAEAQARSHSSAAAVADALENLKDALTDMASQTKSVLPGISVSAIAGDNVNGKLYALTSDLKKVYSWNGTKSADITSDDLPSFTTLGRAIEMNANGDALTIVDSTALYAFNTAGEGLKFVGSKNDVVAVARLNTTASFDGSEPDEPTQPDEPTKEYAEVTESAATDAQKTEALKALEEQDFDNFTVGDKVFVPAGTAGEKVDVAYPGTFAYSSKVFFVEVTPTTAEASVAAAGEFTAATLTDVNHNAITSGKSTYAEAELTAGSTYAVVEATNNVQPDPDNPGSTGGSGGGCNAGFAGIAALAVLALIKKSK
ncbi:MAG: SYNERG-CTERM sorting domain-containing protein [Synergistaceae bacterium]|nr:SYNERG-CTERM sorting domain-containing protein [Synergistaceae bacterium]